MAKIQTQFSEHLTQSQVFACLAFVNQTWRMDIVKIRRSQLKKWFDGKKIPESEKSYISQLINGKASFGEKAARRIENDYEMGDGYLDNLSIHDLNIDASDKELVALIKMLQQIPKENRPQAKRLLDVANELSAKTGQKNRKKERDKERDKEHEEEQHYSDK